MIARMMKRIAPIAAAVLMLILAASPAAAYTVLKTTGTVGAWQLTDTAAQPGGICKFGPDQGGGYREPETVKIHPPTFWGYFPNDTWVGWRVKLISNSPEGPGDVYWASPIQKAKANSTTAANGFSNISHAAADFTTVRVIMYFYKPGSQSNWTGNGGGRVVTELEWFDYKWDGVVQYQDTGCHV